MGALHAHRAPVCRECAAELPGAADRGAPAPTARASRAPLSPLAAGAPPPDREPARRSADEVGPLAPPGTRRAQDPKGKCAVIFSDCTRMTNSSSPPRSVPSLPIRTYSVEPGPGRLLLLRVYKIDSVEQVAQYFLDVRTAAQSLGGRVVACVDYRPMRIFNRVVSEEMARGMADTNANIERSALISARGRAIQSLQSSRLIKSAGLTQRRQFVDEVELILWLNEVLSFAEQSRLRRFLAEYDSQ